MKRRFFSFRARRTRTKRSASMKKGGLRRPLLTRHHSAAELGTTLVGRLAAELLFDAQQLVVLGDAVGAAQRAGLDLTSGSADGEIGDGAVFGLAGAM